MASSRQERQKHLNSVRETVESVWIAIVLAFVLRAFVLEAFVIPTGSMAPRLMGEHWEFDCRACGYHYARGVDGRVQDRAAAPPRAWARREQAVCPTCGYEMHPPPDSGYGGDRVLVLKYLYHFRRPKPWDVVVFKNPQDNEQNYIKRLIGLPAQEIEIVHGDVFYRECPEDLTGDGVIDERDFKDPRAARYPRFGWRILRKPPRTQEVMWQVIFDNDYQPDPAVYNRHPPGGHEWMSPWQPEFGPKAWDLSRCGGRVFAFLGKHPSALRFTAARHRFMPEYAYNRPGANRSYDEQTDVCSDLKLSFLFAPRAPGARVGLHLSGLGDHFRAWISADGRCELEHGVSQTLGEVRWERQKWGEVVLEPFQLGRAYDVALTNVDRRVTLWIDGRAVLQSTEAQYPSDKDRIVAAVARGVPTPEVSILGRGGRFELWHIRLMRDVFYTTPNVWTSQDTGRPGHGTTGNPMILRRFLRNPDLDEFFVLGDNSPSSKDSRMWGEHAATLRRGYRDGTVPRYNMIGKAFLVYWPGGHRLSLLKSLAIVPNFGRIRLIR